MRVCEVCAQGSINELALEVGAASVFVRVGDMCVQGSIKGQELEAGAE